MKITGTFTITAQTTGKKLSKKSQNWILQDLGEDLCRTAKRTIEMTTERYGHTIAETAHIKAELEVQP